MTLTRRHFLATAMAGTTLAMAGGIPTAATNVAYVTSDGTGNGTSWDDSASIGSIPALAQRVGPGGLIAVLGEGQYEVEDTIDLSDAAQVTISGCSRQLAPRLAKIVGTRRGWSGGKVNAEGFGGNTLFRIGSGASGLVLANFDVRNVGRVADMSGSRAARMTIQNVKFSNIRDGIYTDGSSAVSGLTIRNFSGHGFSKKAIRFHGRSSGWVIENCELDSGEQYGDEFSVGIECHDKANGLQISGGFTANCLDQRPQDKYWNGDGVAAERGNYNIVIQNHRSYGNSDGGYDLKSESTQLINCVSEKNKRNFRIWGGTSRSPVQLQGCRSLRPTDRGGIGDAHHMWLSGAEGGSRKAAHVVWQSGLLTGGNTKTAIYAEGGGVDVQLVNTDTSGLPRSMVLFSSSAESSQLRQG
jgi:serralysin